MHLNRLARVWSRTKAVSAQLILSSSQTDWWINVYLRKPGEGKLWKVKCYYDPVSLCNESLHTTDSKAGTGDEWPQLRTDTACEHILPSSVVIPGDKSLKQAWNRKTEI